MYKQYCIQRAYLCISTQGTLSQGLKVRDTMTRGNFDGPMMSKIKYAGVDPRVLRLKNGFLTGETRDLIPSIGSRVSNGRKWGFESKDGRSTAN